MQNWWFIGNVFMVKLRETYAACTVMVIVSSPVSITIGSKIWLQPGHGPGPALYVQGLAPWGPISLMGLGQPSDRRVDGLYPPLKDQSINTKLVF